MVHKVKIFIFFIILIVLGFFALNFSGKIETNLLRTLIPQEAVNSTDIIEIEDKISSDVKVVFESDDENNLEELRKNFTNKIDTGYFKLDNTDYTELIKLYSNYPSNFLSYNTRTILKDKNYEMWKEVYEKVYGIPLTYSCDN